MSEKRVMVCDWCGAEGDEDPEWGIYIRYPDNRGKGPDDTLEFGQKSEDICPDCNGQVKTLRQAIQEPSKGP